MGWAGPLGLLPTRHLALQSLGPSARLRTSLEGGCFLLYWLWCLPLWLLVGTAASCMLSSNQPDDRSGQGHAVPGAHDPPVGTVATNATAALHRSPLKKVSGLRMQLMQLGWQSACPICTKFCTSSSVLGTVAHTFNSSAGGGEG